MKIEIKKLGQKFGKFVTENSYGFFGIFVDNVLIAVTVGEPEEF